MESLLLTMDLIATTVHPNHLKADYTFNERNQLLAYIKVATASSRRPVIYLQLVDILSLPGIREKRSGRHHGYSSTKTGMRRRDFACVSDRSAAAGARPALGGSLRSLGSWIRSW